MKRLAVCLTLALAAVACGAGAPPQASENEFTSVPGGLPTQGARPTQDGPERPGSVNGEPTPAPAITEARAVEVEWPVTVRAGNSDLIRLSLVARDDGYLTPTAEFEGSETSATPIEIPNLYDTHTVRAIARLDSVGLTIDRPGDWEQTLQAGQPLRWQWTVRAPEAGRQIATLTLRLRFEPRAGGAALEQEIYNRALTVESQTVFGFPGPVAQWAGGLGSVVGAVLGFPFVDKIIEVVWSRLFSRRRRDLPG